MRRSDKKREKKGLPKIEKRTQPFEGVKHGPDPERKVAGTIQIIVYEDLDVDVQDFPTDHGVAMMALCNAMMKDSSFFLKEAAKPKQLIQVAKPTLSLADIEKLAKEAKNN